eukprot:CAMPEP_0119283804 /NCGR_PEP_ID=MMETSP1329-20130426/29195_1 /TAXON_ID=114041 /ORGANISM="Genus nov. species nov., Strain RCC1024" /LENGTH=143 /DNA_ID=CAMNT_0007284477 /DNA_START=86 /DNA_END=514 /DNA_ORIENTATION=-
MGWLYAIWLLALRTSAFVAPRPKNTLACSGGTTPQPRIRPFARVPEAHADDLRAVYGDAGCEPTEGIEEHLFSFNKIMVHTMKGLVDLVFKDRDYARFYALETLARVPYFAYVAVLHAKETFGERDPNHAARIRVHFAEADNE